MVILIREDNTLPILCLGLFRHVSLIASSGYMTWTHNNNLVLLSLMRYDITIVARLPI